MAGALQNLIEKGTILQQLIDSEMEYQADCMRNFQFV